MAIVDHAETGDRVAIGAEWRRRADAAVRPPGFLALLAHPRPTRGSTATASACGRPELDCLRGVLAPGLLGAASARADELGIGADQVLIQWGVIDEGGLSAAAGASSRHRPRRLRARRRAATRRCATTRSRSPRHPALMPLRQDGGLIWVLAPRGMTARTLCDPVRASCAAQRDSGCLRRVDAAIPAADRRCAARRHATFRSAAPLSGAVGRARRGRRAAGPTWRQRLTRGAAVAAW